jgi:hypothetical protein
VLAKLRAADSSPDQEISYRESGGVGYLELPFPGGPCRRRGDLEVSRPAQPWR